ncbi:DUF4982 domain-containing protein [Butyrivibrio sp. YAB3001]|uniref:DUF4982 domain-containing protein n=1 Tax=Butyrivibrio sp. YAB3001 TaxID=1520812 RepID=UPI0008F6783F|nr:DUF4982 domain-containing protein [Butyrivibrio sp. YAB3001]SFC21792.1 beta-galactosidase [Butyrivibrio sp. YAB3001]
MKKLFTEGWKFWEAEFGTSYETAMEHLPEFKQVDIPHDYLIHDTANLYKDSTGWYVKDFSLSSDDIKKKIYLIFDGIYMDSIVYVNGKAAGEWKYGYSQFVLDITAFLTEGENHLAVAARNKFPNTRWYSGAGIYRNVWICDYNDIFIPENGIYVHSVKKNSNGSGHDYYLYVNTEICGDVSGNSNVTHELFDTEGNKIPLISVPLSEVKEVTYGVNSFDSNNVSEDVTSDERKLTCLPSRADARYVEKAYLVENVNEWDVENPVLYSLLTKLYDGSSDVEGVKAAGNSKELEKDAAKDATSNGVILQEEKTTVGFRTTEFNPEHGFFLNGKNIKLNGVCIHHDLGALGSAYNHTAMRRRLIQLKEMGVNAIRLTHNMYDPDVIRLADEMGFMLISESFDMWVGSKTEFDYARFFPKWHARDVESWVRRDRNHPSVIMWSIGNEIYDTHSNEKGEDITRDLKNLVETFDPLKNARATIGSNYMPWERAQRCADILKVAGYNYAENYYKEHHKAHPDWIIYGSETYSIVQSRGVYHFPLAVPTLCESDQQCSSLGNSTTSWGADSIEACICKDRDMEFSMGQFIWTGYDYIGEPTPYQTKNSYFGLIDTAGFYKDAFYAWKSAWVSAEKDPFVHVFPYWDFNEGQQIDVRVCSNADEVELFLNGKSLGRQQLTHAPHSGDKIFADYSVIYEPGEIKAVAYDTAGNVIAEDSHKSFGDTDRFVVDIDHKLDKYGERDLIFAEISALDKEGNPVENASDYVNVSVSGDGQLIGLDNGDSTDYDSYQSSCRKLFNGKLLAIVKCTGDPDSVKVEVSRADKVPVRSIKLEVQPCDDLAENLNILTSEHPKVKVVAKVYPEDATDKEVVFRALNRNGTDTNIAKFHAEGNTCEIEAMGDGDFVIRCEAKSGREVVAVMSNLEFKVSGMGAAFLDPYGFIPGSLYTSFIGKIGNGNEHGVASAKDGETVVSYSGIDFGKDGSDEITIPIFTLNDDEYRFEIWKGIPGEEGSKLLKEAFYQKKSIWNTYQEDTWKLSERLTGLQTISLRLFNKYHIKGFSFARQNRAFVDVRALDADSIYGDTFTKTDGAVEGIGNNVTIAFDDYNFGESGTKQITICGRAKAAANTIHLRMKKKSLEGINAEAVDSIETLDEVKEILEFPQTDEYSEVTFEIGEKKGNWDISFVFLPGSNFDFKSFRFEK